MVRINDGGSISFLTSADGVTTTALKLNDSNWHRYVITREGNTTNLAKIYVDGALNGTGTIVGNLTDAYPLRIGTSPDGNYLTNTTLDEMIIINGYAWNQTEVTNDFTNPVSNINISIGGNVFANLFVSNYTIYNKMVSINNFSGYVNNYLSTCSYVGGLCQVPIMFVSQNNSKVGYSAINFDNFGFTENNQYYNLLTYETQKESFYLNVTYDDDYYSSVSALLFYNGSYYNPAKTSYSYGALFYSTVDIPLINYATANNSFYWVLNLTNSSGTSNYNTTQYNQTVNRIWFGLCNSTLNVPFVNFTFKDETTLLFMNATLVSSYFTYWMNSSSINKTYSYSTTNNYTNYTFCFSPQSKPVNLDLQLYYSAYNYPQRAYSFLGIYSNQTINNFLLLLQGSMGGYYTQQVLSLAGQPLSNVHVTVEKLVGSTYSNVGEGYTGDDGSITFWLDFNYPHRFTYEKDGYTTETRTVTPTTSGSTVYLGSSTTVDTINDYGKGISYDAKPDDVTLLNNTVYSFNFTLSSTYWDVSSFGFILKNSSGSALGSASASTNGGVVNVNLNTNNLSLIIMNAYWIINGSYSNVTFYWSIFNEEDTGWSLKTFFDDLKTFTGTEENPGIFGLNEFSRTLIIFFIIFMIVGAMSYYSGVDSPAAIIWAIFALVAFFDFGVGLIANPIEAIDNFPTFFVLFLAITITIWEASR